MARTRKTAQTQLDPAAPADDAARHLADIKRLQKRADDLRGAYEEDAATAKASKAEWEKAVEALQERVRELDRPVPLFDHAEKQGGNGVAPAVVEASGEGEDA